MTPNLTLVLLLAGLLSAGAAQAQLLGPRTDLNTGAVPRSVAIGDVDQDGAPDIVVTVQGAGLVSVFPGNGNLTFRPRIDVPVHAQPIALALTDWTGDGKLDLLVGAAGDTSLTVHAGNGAGGFTEHASVKCPTIPYEIEVADVTGDGLADAVVAADETSVALFDVPGTPGGNLGTPRVWIAATSDRSRSIELAQLDGQFGIDVYFSSTLGPSQVLYSDGAGGFLAPVSVTGSGPSSGAAVADIDLDGRLDVVEVGATVANGFWRILRGQVGGALALVATGTIGPGPISPVLRDLNLDGRPDLAVAHQTGSYVGVSLGSCTFEPPLVANVDFDPGDLALGDLDGDGDFDFVTANLSGASVSIRRNDGGAATPCAPVASLTPTALDFGELPAGYVSTSLLRVRNVGNGDLLLTGAALSTAAFAVGPLPLQGIAAGAFVDLSVQALRPDLGVAEDTLVLQTNSPGVPTLRVPLRSVARPPLPPALIASPTQLAFPLAPQFNTSTLAVQVTNVGEVTLVLSDPSFATTEFSAPDTYPISIAPGQVRNVSVRYPRSTIGSFADTLRVTTNAPATPQLAIPVTGSARVAAPPLPGISPTSLDFGTGAQGLPRTLDVLVRNDGESAYSVTSYGSTSTQFDVVTALPLVVGPGQQMVVSVRHLRPVIGIASATITLVTDDPLHPALSLAVSGTTVYSTAYAILGASALEFGDGAPGDVTERTLEIQSVGPEALSVQGMTASNPGITVLATFPIVINSWAPRTFRIQFTRGAPGPLLDTLVITTSSTPDPVRRVALGGMTRRPPIAAVEPTPLPLVTLPFGSADTRQLTLRNDGDEWPLYATATVVFDSVASAASTAWPPGELLGESPGPVALPQLRLDAEAHAWDIQADGSIGQGDPAAFAGGLAWTGFPAQASALLRDGGRTIELGPVVSGNLEFTRRVHVSPSEPLVRYLETVRNISLGNVTYRLPIASTMDVATPRLSLTSSGDGGLQTGDDWIVVEDDVEPVIAHVFAGPGGALRPVFTSLGSGLRVVRYEFQFTLAAGASASILHFALQAPTRALAIERAEALRTPFGGALVGLTGTERARVLNFGIAGPFSVPIPEVSVPPLSTAPLLVAFDGGSGVGDETSHGTLRIATNDPLHPLLVVALELYVGPSSGAVLDGSEPGDGPALALAARFVPNPAIGRGLRLSYALPTAGEARFELYDVRGRRIDARVLPAAAAGRGMLDWSGGSSGAGGGVALAPGVYWTRLTHGGKSVVTKGVVLR